MFVPISKDGKILLIEDKRTKEWSLPGGFAEIGLSPEENVRKEVYEETGLTVESTQLRAVLIRINKKIFRSFFSIISLFLLVRSTMKMQNLLRTTKLPTWVFSIEELPKLSEKRTTKKQLLILENKTSFIAIEFFRKKKKAIYSASSLKELVLLLKIVAFATKKR